MKESNFLNDEQNNTPNIKTSQRRYQKQGISQIDINDLYQGIIKGDRAKLARAITLVESNAAHHLESAQILLQKISELSPNTIRIGISGVPGAGKSTFIESLGTFLCNKGHRVAVLAVDPSSNLSGGSILGDKTRMEELSRNPCAFIRPSPTGGTLGGVHRKTRESITLCEAANYDVILVETVGVGQSEAMVREMVDFFLLLVLTGAGDELQGMKKGIMELADAIIVNKADGSNLEFAQKTKEEYSGILHFIHPATKGWETKAYTCSSLTSDGISEFWEVINRFKKLTRASGVFQQRRKSQLKDWMNVLIGEELKTLFYQNSVIRKLLPQAEQEVISGNQPATKAVQHLFTEFIKSLKQ